LHFLPFNTHWVFNEYYEKKKSMQINTLGKDLLRNANGLGLYPHTKDHIRWKHYKPNNQFN
jgi:hypothetical protein